MLYDEPDPSDPNLLVGVAVPGDPRTDLEMAYAFAEEYAGLGYSQELIRGLFRSPRYPALLRLTAKFGEDEIRRIVEECCEVWGRVRVVVKDARPDTSSSTRGCPEEL